MSNKKSKQTQTTIPVVPNSPELTARMNELLRASPVGGTALTGAARNVLQRTMEQDPTDVSYLAGTEADILRKAQESFDTALAKTRTTAPGYGAMRGGKLQAMEAEAARKMGADVGGSLAALRDNAVGRQQAAQLGATTSAVSVDDQMLNQALQIANLLRGQAATTVTPGGGGFLGGLV